MMVMSLVLQIVSHYPKYRNRKVITKVVLVNPLGTMNVCTSCMAMSQVVVEIFQSKGWSDVAIHRAMHSALLKSSCAAQKWCSQLTGSQLTVLLANLKG